MQQKGHQLNKWQIMTHAGLIQKIVLSPICATLAIWITLLIFNQLFVMWKIILIIASTSIIMTCGYRFVDALLNIIQILQNKYRIVTSKILSKKIRGPYLNALDDRQIIELEHECILVRIEDTSVLNIGDKISAVLIERKDHPILIEKLFNA